MLFRADSAMASAHSVNNACSWCVGTVVLPWSLAQTATRGAFTMLNLLLELTLLRTSDTNTKMALPVSVAGVAVELYVRVT